MSEKLTIIAFSGTADKMVPLEVLSQSAAVMIIEGMDEQMIFI